MVSHRPVAYLIVWRHPKWLNVKHLLPHSPLDPLTTCQLHSCPVLYRSYEEGLQHYRSVLQKRIFLLLSLNQPIEE